MPHRKSSLRSVSRAVVVLFFDLCLTAPAALAQTTAFTYQGRLNDGGALANGPYDLEFRLFDALAGGVQQGATVTVEDVAVASGIFSVSLDFGAAAFPVGARFLEISVRPGASVGAFTLLSPRQPVTSTPYAVRSLNASAADSLSIACVNCVSSGQIGAVNGSQISGAIPVASLPAGSGNYVQNSTTQQTTSNFNISGDGTAGGTLSANTVNAATQYNIGGNRVLSVAGSANTFAGAGAGAANTLGIQNAFFGSGAGTNNNTGARNTFVGVGAGAANVDGHDSAFFGFNAGLSNTGAGGMNPTGNLNSFFGMNAGRNDTTGGSNSFFGANAGRNTTSANSNSFFGANAGFNGTAGSDNSFFGAGAGQFSTTGSANSFFGAGAGQVNDADFNAFIGASAGTANTTGSFNTFTGSSAGEANTTGAANTFIGRTAGAANTTGSDNTFTGGGTGSANTTGFSNSFFGRSAGLGNTSGFDNTFIGRLAGDSNTTGDNNTIIGAGADLGGGNLDHATAIGADAIVSASNTIVLGRSGGEDEVVVQGPLFVGTLGQASSTHVCINAFTHLSTCSSSMRYKEQVRPLHAGLNLLQRLRPVTFNWKATGEHDLGLIAEEVAAAEPLLITRNKNGEIEGVKYDQLSVVLINAVREQQEIIKTQQQRVQRQEDRHKQQEEMLKDQLQQLSAQHHVLARLQREVERLKRRFAASRPALSRKTRQKVKVTSRASQYGARQTKDNRRTPINPLRSRRACGI